MNAEQQLFNVSCTFIGAGEMYLADGEFCGENGLSESDIKFTIFHSVQFCFISKYGTFMGFLLNAMVEVFLRKKA